MRYFLAYHNAEKMGLSCTAIAAPMVMTSKPVKGLECSTVWLIAGEGKTPKRFYLASRFVIDRCESNKHVGTELPNQVSGTGVLLGTSISLSSTPLLAQLRKLSANFVNGFFELHDPSAIAALKDLA